MNGETADNPYFTHSRTRMIIAWALVVLWAVFIFFMSAHTGDDLTNGTGIVATVKRWLGDIQNSLVGTEYDLVSPIAHFCEYTVFGGIMLSALRISGLRKYAVLIAVAICAAYAVTDEIHQIFVPGRACDPVDWIVDVCGSLLGAVIANIAIPSNRRS